MSIFDLRESVPMLTGSRTAIPDTRASVFELHISESFSIWDEDEVRTIRKLFQIGSRYLDREELDHTTLASFFRTNHGARPCKAKAMQR